MKDTERGVYYIEVVGRALDLLEVFLGQEHPQLSLKEIAGRLDQSPNMTFRLLYTLAEHGFVIKSNRKYELGSRLLDLGNAKLSNKDLASRAGPQMDVLCRRFRETVNLAVMMEGEIRYIAVRQSPERLSVVEIVGGSDPLHCTALGKAHLAYLPFGEVRDLLRRVGMTKVTEFAITSLARMKAELELTRERGFALDIQESMLGGFCVAVPIFDAKGKVGAAMSVSGPYARFHEAHVKEVVSALRAAVKIVGQVWQDTPARVAQAKKRSVKKSA